MRRILKLAAGVAGLLACAMIGLGVSVAVGASGEQVVVTGHGWTCSGPVDLDLVKVTDPGGDGIRLSAGCTGSIDRIEVSGVRNGDGIKVSNPSSGHAHDLTIGGGYVQCQAPTDGTHQDGIQAMGGERILIRNVVFDCVGGGGGQWFVQRAVSANTPTDIVCEGCAISPRHPNAVNLGASVRSGMRDSLICQPFSGRRAWADSEATSPVNDRNLVVANSDPRCASLGSLRAWADGGPPPPPTEPPTTTEPPPVTTEPPPTTTEPPPTTTGPEPPTVCDQACVDTYQARIAALGEHVTALETERAALIGQLDQEQADNATLEARIVELEQQLAATEGAQAEISRLNGIIDAAQAELNQR